MAEPRKEWRQGQGVGGQPFLKGGLGQYLRREVAPLDRDLGEGHRGLLPNNASIIAFIDSWGSLTTARTLKSSAGSSRR